MDARPKSWRWSSSLATIGDALSCQASIRAVDAAAALTALVAVAHATGALPESVFSPSPPAVRFLRTLVEALAVYYGAAFALDAVLPALLGRKRRSALDVQDGRARPAGQRRRDALRALAPNVVKAVYMWMAVEISMAPGTGGGLDGLTWRGRALGGLATGSAEDVLASPALLRGLSLGGSAFGSAALHRLGAALGATLAPLAPLVPAGAGAGLSRLASRVSAPAGPATAVATAAAVVVDVVIAAAALDVVHDAYFYVTHRWLHTRWAMRRVHWMHHQSR